MANVYRTKAQIEQDFMAVFEALTSNRVSDLNEGSVLRTLFKVLAEEQEETDYAILQAYDRASAVTATGDDLDRIGESEGVTRNPSVKASGYCYLNLADEITAGADGPVIPAGTVIVSNGSRNYVSTVACRIFTGQSRYVVDDGSYANDRIAFECTIAGKDGNSGAATITSKVAAPPDANSVTNPAAFTNGSEIEPDEDYRARILLARDTLASGSHYAIEGGALEEPGVFDAKAYEWTNSTTDSKYVKPSPGEVWVVVYPTFDVSNIFGPGRGSDGYAYEYDPAADDLRGRVRNRLEDYRGYPTTCKVFDAYSVLVNPTIVIKLPATYRLDDIPGAQAEIAQRLRTYVLGLKIGQTLTIGAIYNVIAQVVEFDSADITLSVTRNRTELDTHIIATNLVAERDECIKPAGAMSGFGSVSISY